MPAPAPNPISTRYRVLVVEDEVLIAMALEDILGLLGHVVVAAPGTYADAVVAVDAGGFDVAVLDVNIGRDPVFPLADRLMALGTRIVFATGSSRESLPERFRGVPCLEKPYAFQSVESAFEKL